MSTEDLVMRQLQVSQNQRYLFGSPHNKDYRVPLFLETTKCSSYPLPEAV